MRQLTGQIYIKHAKQLEILLQYDIIQTPNAPQLRSVDARRFFPECRTETFIVTFNDKLKYCKVSKDTDL